MNIRAVLWTLIVAGALVSVAGCTASTSCAGVGFVGAVGVDLAAVHRQHPGALTVKLCVDGSCNTGSLAANQDHWTDAADSALTRNIEVIVTDTGGRQIFTDAVRAAPTKVVFDQGQCDEQTGHSNLLVAGGNGSLTSVAVTATVASGP